MANVNKPYKITLIGEGGVGKTRFLSKFLSHPPPASPTLGLEIRPVVFPTLDGEVTVHFWDCGGTKPFDGLGPKTYGESSDVFIIVYKDLEKANEWFAENIGQTDIPCKLVSTDDENVHEIMANILDELAQSR